jgi:hypothetical protein
VTGAVRISVLLPTYRQPEVLLLTLRDLCQQDQPPESWELVILDDGSRDVSAQIAVTAVPEEISVTLRRMPRGGTYSHAALFNELLRLADSGSEAFIHVEDVRVRPDFVSQHAKWHADAGEEPRLVTGPMCEGPSETFDPETCSRWDLMRMSGVQAQAYHCCFQAVFAKSMSYPAALREELTGPGVRGPFDESMSGWGYHETEFAFRAVQAGATCIYDTRCGVYHPAHQVRDDRDYRSIDRAEAQASGTRANIEHLCRKHGLGGLPDWEVGIPLTGTGGLLSVDQLDGVR